MKKALLAVSFGTSVAAAREDIALFEGTLRAAAPERDFFRAFTSPTIRRMLKARGETVPSLAEALHMLAQDGYADVAVQPGCILCAGEYDRIAAEIREAEPGFSRVRLGMPLLASGKDLLTAAGILWETYRPEEGGALALFGHGAAHPADMTYAALQTAFRIQGIRDAFVATVEGWPGIDDLIAQLKAGGYRRVTVAPLMLVAGEHALKDMAGERPESWKSRLTAEGFETDCRLRGLGKLPAIRALYAEHLKTILE